MLTGYFDSPARIQALRAGPAGGLIEAFAHTLSRAGYAEITARRHLRAAEHLVYWAGHERTPVRDLTEHSLERFARHLRRCRCPRYGHAGRADLLRGARLFLKHLRDAGIIMPRIDKGTVFEPALLIGFCRWMRRQRGSCEATLSNYGPHIRALVGRLGEDPGRYDARSLRQFAMDVSHKGSWAAKTCTTALRMFLRFLIAEGKCATGLDAAIPIIAHWRLAVLPRYLC